MRFSDITGNHELKSTLISAVKRSQVAHAQLYHGDQGGAALPIARAFTQYLLCTNRETNDSCGVCPSCHRVSRSVHPDVHYYYPKPSLKNEQNKEKKLERKWRDFILQFPYADLNQWLSFAELENKNVQISKEETRKIVQSISLKSFESKYKVVIIWCAHLMNASSANAILKVLEEPPDGTVFLLVSFSKEKMLATIISRVQQMRVSTFSSSDMEQMLLSQGLGIADSRIIAKKSRGNMTKALHLATRSDDLGFSYFQEWMRACIKNDFTLLVDKSEGFSQLDKANQKNLFAYCIDLIRESIVSHCNGDKLILSQGKELEFVNNFGKAVGIDVLEGIYKSINDAFMHIERNANPRITHLKLSLQIGHLMSKNP